MSNIIELRGGLLVRADAIALLISLEAKGCVCSIRDGALAVTNARTLTTEDTKEIKRLRGFLLALVAYEPPAL